MGEMLSNVSLGAAEAMSWTSSNSPAGCAPRWSPAARFPTVYFLRAAVARQNPRTLATSAKPMLANRSWTGKFMLNEPHAKPILPEPRSVQKANSDQ